MRLCPMSLVSRLALRSRAGKQLKTGARTSGESEGELGRGYEIEMLAAIGKD